MPEGHSQLIGDLPVYKGDHDCFRYVDVGVSRETFDSLNKKSGDWYLQTAVNVITAHFCRTEDERTAIYRLLADITAQGSAFETIYREKETSSLTARVSVAVAQDLTVIPLVSVTDREGNVLLEKRLAHMEPMDFVNQFGTLLLNSKRLTIRPRRNEHARDMGEIMLPIGEGQ